MKLDLHTHTIYSDGDLDVLGNVSKAMEYGFDAIAITDHDNIASWQDIDKNEYPIKVIKGVELSTRYRGDSVHILGYYLKDGGDYTELETFLEKNRQDRLDRLDKMIKLLEKLGIFLTKEEILQEADGAVARPHVARAILKKYPEMGLNMDDVFERYIGHEAPAYVPVNDLSVEEAIDLLHRNHCLAIIAHPLLIHKFDYRELESFSIDGLECFYPYSDGFHQEVIDFAEKNQLLVTGGSDFHGPKTRNTMGLAFLSDSYAKEFLQKVQ